MIRLKVRSIQRQFMKNMTIQADIRKMNNDYKKNYSLLNQDLHLAVDASDLLSARYPNPSGVKVKYQKTKLSTHTTIDINLVADDDNTRQVTFLVNGGQYAIEERISYVNELKRIFNYENNHLKK